MYNLQFCDFNQLLINYRKSRGLTLEDLGKKIGKSKSTVSKYEKGEIIPDIITVLEICNVLNITLSQLFPLDASVSENFSNNPFVVDKLYLYYYTNNTLVTSVLEIQDEVDSIFVKFYNGIKNLGSYAYDSCYYYEGFMECDKTIGYISLCNSSSKKILLENVRICFNIPWSKNFKATSFFILGLTPNSIPVVKRGILSIYPIDDVTPYEDYLKISNDDVHKIQSDGAWILEKKNYTSFLFD